MARSSRRWTGANIPAATPMPTRMQNAPAPSPGWGGWRRVSGRTSPTCSAPMPPWPIWRLRLLYGSLQALMPIGGPHSPGPACKPGWRSGRPAIFWPARCTSYPHGWMGQRVCCLRVRQRGSRLGPPPHCQTPKDADMVGSVLVGMLCAHLLCFAVMFLLISKRLQGKKMGMDFFAMGNLLLGLAYVLQLVEGGPAWSMMSVVNRTGTDSVELGAGRPLRHAVRDVCAAVPGHDARGTLWCSHIRQAPVPRNGVFRAPDQWHLHSERNQVHKATPGRTGSAAHGQQLSDGVLHLYVFPGDGGATLHDLAGVPAPDR